MWILHPASLSVWVIIGLTLGQWAGAAAVPFGFVP